MPKGRGGMMMGMDDSLGSVDSTPEQTRNQGSCRMEITTSTVASCTSCVCLCGSKDRRIYTVLSFGHF